jgi:ubiquinone/menaquinone biosynthesis C-methylase UbiE
MDRIPEPELMDLEEEVRAYADADFSEVNQKFVADLLAWTKRSGTAQVIDLGCGPGDIAILLALKRPEWAILGVDGSDAMLREAAARQKTADVPNVRLLRADACRVPVAGDTFDMVTSNSLLHHLPRPEHLWREVWRITRSGGEVFLRDLLRPDDATTAQRIVETHAGSESPLLKEEFFRSLLSAFTIPEIKSQLAEAGIFDAQVEQISDRHVDVRFRKA